MLLCFRLIAQVTNIWDEYIFFKAFSIVSSDRVNVLLNAKLVSFLQKQGFFSVELNSVAR
jgi:hypothetical protein